MKSLEFDVESLESRELLAGTVLVEYSADNNLSLVGDRFDNSVTIERSSFGTEISGLDGTQLMFNGGLMNSLTLDTNGDPIEGIFVHMDRGDDRVSTDDVSIRGQLDVDMGAGDDTFIKFRNEFNGDAIIRGGRGNGNDIVTATGEFNGDLVVELGSAAQQNKFELKNSTINGDLVVSGRQAYIDVENVGFSNDMILKTQRDSYTTVQDVNVEGDIQFEQTGRVGLFSLSEAFVCWANNYVRQIDGTSGR